MDEVRTSFALTLRLAGHGFVDVAVEGAISAYFFWRQRLMRQNTVDLIGYFAAICTTVSFLPQLVRVLKLRSAREISLGMFLVLSFGTVLWLTYGLLSHSWPVTLANAVTLGLTISILILKLRFDRNTVRETTKA